MRQWIRLFETFDIPTLWYHSTELDPYTVATDFAHNNMNPVGGTLEHEYWFSDDWEASRYYGQNTVIATLDIRNPLLVSSEEYTENARKFSRGPSSYWAKKAKEEGYDAVIIHDICDGDMFSTVCAVFSPTQIHAKPYAKYNEETDEFDLI